MNYRITILSSLIILLLSTTTALANLNCRVVFEDYEGSSYNQILFQMHRDPYPEGHLPVRPITLFRSMARQILPGFFVGERSFEILNEKRDFREVGLPKPIHPMGVGFEGVLELRPSRWSGAFRGGRFPVLARASISQGNPYKQTDPSPILRKLGVKPKAQARSTAFALKIFGSSNFDEVQKTANIVFQNDLNGEINFDGSAIHWNQADQTNHPSLNLAKIRHMYELLTLIGVARGSLKTPKDQGQKFPYINPAIRPVHSLAELGESRPENIHTPIWVLLRPSRNMIIVDRDDFREELKATTIENGDLTYDFFAADSLNQLGQKMWEQVGTLRLHRPIVSRGVDENLLFPHDTLVSSLTGKAIKVPNHKD